ncbi:MAG: ankyrin repeat domain-containing protein [Bacteroidales bacterium]|nr:ankyrin repeat domain-containing protein [Bacteroidales bacterium]
MNDIANLIPLPLLIICLFYLLGAGIRRLYKKYTGGVISTIVLTLLHIWMLFPILPFPLLAVLFGAGFMGGVVLARNDRVLKIAVIFLIIVVTALSLSQFIAITGISKGIPPFESFFEPRLVFFNFTEIIFGSIIVAFLFVILQRYLCKILNKKNNGACILLAVTLTYFAQQFIHLEHPGLGYIVVFGHALSSQLLSILSFGGLFWTIVLIINIVLSLYFGIMLYSDFDLLKNFSNQIYNRVMIIGAVYFMLFHMISLSFLYADYDLLNAIMMIMLSAITIPFGVTLGYAFNQSLIDKLSLAARDGEYNQVGNALNRGIEINKKDKDGYTPLILAAHNGHIKIVRLLLEKGARVDLKDVNGSTALSSACGKGHYEIVQLLINEGADLNSKDNDGNSPYISAIFGGHTNICELLAKNGANTQEKHPQLGLEAEEISRIIGPFRDFVRKHQKD